MQSERIPLTAAELTERELEILKLVATGTSNKDIARQLFISSNTVKAHLRNIFAKTGTNSRTEAAVYAIHAGITPSGGLPELEPVKPPEEIVERKRRPAVFWLAILGLPVLLIAAVAVFLVEKARAPLAVATSNASVENQRWQGLAALPTARSNLALAVYEEDIYAIGGETGQGVSAVVERYNVAEDKWSALASLPVPVSDINAAAIGGKIYVPGGVTASGNATNALEVYDPGQDRWEKGAALPAALSAYALAAYEGRLYVFGGWDGKKPVGSVYVYDPIQNNWTSKALMPTARAFEGAAIAGGGIYVLGGYNGKAPLAANEEYLPDQDAWSVRAALPAGRYGMGVASIADLIYVVGGKGATEAAMPPLQYTFQQDQWLSFKDPIGKPWSQLGLVPIQTRLYAIGGRLDGAPSFKNISYQAIYSIMIPVVP
ncbi:MAG TPA: LuxR C-terminal-related transcriptional regulator [Anaerolineales bacterium]|nr:LuxR C-terminal-related transcriptional regulator [Anaerolineales bacterium]